MFRWAFAEALLSRWAIKRLCKFLLKKKLGDFILGEIDLDQLEVQLTRGTIQLSDVAVNVDYINQKLSGAVVMLKEGSIASLSITVPWKLQNCQIELEELELVLAPFSGSKIQVPDFYSELISGDKHMNHVPDKNEQGTSQENCGSTSLDIHEGVKMVAKIVKWLLTSFQIRIKNLIVVFDPCLEVNEDKFPDNKSLVFRIAEAEFGTNLSEDTENKTHILKSDCILGTAKLTNFVKFDGALIEVLTMNDIDKSHHSLNCSETTSDRCNSSSLPSGSVTTILTSRGRGISGRMNLSIPWKNGSLDIHKVDAVICFDPIELRLQPSTIEWIIFVWESLRYAGTAVRSSVHCAAIDSGCSNSRLFRYSPVRNSTILGTDVAKPSIKKNSVELHSDNNGEIFPEALLPRTHVIQDWVPLSFKEDQAELEQDYGASIDQFFECFDGLRSSQANSETSVWNWPYSVFNAINVASNLAAGSDHILSEYVETCLRVTVTGISLFLYFHDMEDTIYDPLLGGDRDTNESCPWNHLDTATSCIQDPLSGLSSMDASQSTTAEPDSTGLKIHHLEAKCQDIFIEFQQISSQIKDCQVSIKHFKIDEYYDHKSCVRMFGFFDNNSCDLMLINSTLKQKVLGALTPFPVFSHAYDSEKSLLHNAGLIYENYSNEQFIKVGLMESLGDFNLHCTIRLTDMNQTPVSSTSFSLHLPPCVLWFHFHLADSLLNLFKNVEACFKKGRENRDLSDESSYGKKLVCPHGLKSGVSSIKTVPTGDSVKGNFVFSHLRIIICFPLQSLEDFDNLYLMDKFIILEHCPFVEELSHVSSFPLNQLSAPNGSSCTSTFSFHFEVGTFDLYLANTINKDATVDQSVPLQVKDVSGVKVLTLISRTCDKHSGISMILQNGSVTGHWMASRAWSMASTHDHRSRNKVTREGWEFSSGNVIDDFEETSSDIRQELIYSSKFFIHLSFSVIRLNLQSHNYEQLNNLLDIVMHGFSNLGSSKFSVFEEDQPLCNHDACQATVVMNCDTLDLCIVLDEVPDCSQLAQKEVLGSWNCFRLIVEKFEIMSALNIGGISGTNFFRLIHGEGKLCGSIFSNDGSVLGQTHDIVLISCTNSTSRRGRGDGTNVLSFSSAGTTITYLCNPQLSRSYTSILVHCGTIVAHGGRLDWIGHIYSFFSLPFENESSGSDANLVKSSDSRTYEASFILDLVDVALCYEPYLKHSALNGECAYAKCDENHELNQETSEQLVGYLLAAASFSISSYSLSNSASIDYTIRLQDLGLLICMPSGMNFRCGSYDVSYLRKSGYAKVASSSLLVAVLRIRGLQWEVECSDSHIIFDTCNDTTHGLFRLIAQLQQLYAPDMEDALAHLQSRWISVQESQNTNGSNETSDISNSSTSLDADMKFPINDDSSLSIRLLDGVVDNAFYITKGSDNLEVENSSSTSNSGFDNIDTSFEKGGFLPQLIETHCFPELITSSLTTKGSPSEVQNLKFDLPDQGKVDRGKGGWYKDEYLMIVDNHIPNSVLPLSDRHQEKNLFVTVDSDAFARRCEKGKILFKNIDVRWHMFAGSDWSKQKINSAGKDTNSSMELSFSGLNIQLSIYPDGDVDVSKLSIHVRDFHVFDRSTNAPWKMVIGQYNSKDHPRESYAKAFKLDLETVRPDPRISLEDYRLYVEFLPVRLHLDQSQINFLINFFGNGSSVEGTLSSTKDVDYINEKKNKAYRGQPIEEEALLPFFQKCVVKPLVVRVDYIPHHMDLTSLSRGNYIELLNLVSWKGIDLNLKQVCAVGIYGWASVCETVAGQWLEDISHNQVHKLLKGLAPVRSLVSVASGTTKLVTLPVKSYKRDGKLLKGMQRGAIAFVRSISLEAVGLGVHLASGVHEILLQTEFILSNVPQSSPVLSEKCRIIKTANSNQPEDAQEGIRQAYESLSEGFSRSASAILGTPMKEYRRGVGAGSALATAVRGTPAAAIAPVTASANAVHRALLGVRNSLDPEHKKESITKYLGPSQS